MVPLPVPGRYFACAILAFLSTTAHAQTVTSIVADTQPALTTATQVSSAGATTTIDGGTRAGANLFHSFSNFDLAAGEIARWVQTTSDPTTVANVISRVTGGSASHIDGTLNSTALPNAAFYFVNPAGIVFGAGAAVNVPASATFTTAQTLRFADGATFSATTANGSTLSAAPIASFGFLGGQGAISASGSGGLFVGRPDVTLAARDVTLNNLTAATSALRIAAVGNAAVGIDPRNPLATKGLTGAVTLTDSIVNTRPNNADGSIMIGGGSVAIANTTLNATTTTNANLGDLAISADTIAVTGLSEVSTVTTGAGNAGNLRLAARSMLVDNASILSRSGLAATGAGGTIFVNADALTVRNAGTLAANTLGAGAAGNIAVATDTATFDGAFVTSNTNAFSTAPGGMVSIATRLLNSTNTNIFANSFGAGNGGSIALTASGPIALDFTYVFSTAFVGSTGNGGAISVQAPLLTMVNDSRIVSATNASGNAGTVGVTVADLRLDASRIATNGNPGSSGNAGTLSIASTSLKLTNGSTIASSTQGGGDGGAVLVQTRDLFMAGFSAIRSSAQLGSTGNAGRIGIASSGIAHLTEGSLIESGTNGPGNAGILSFAGNAIVLDSGLIGTDAFLGSGGNAGSLTVTANSISATNSGLIRSSTVGSGNAGSVSVDVGTGSITLNRSLIGTDALNQSTGNAGSVSVNAGTLIVGSGAFVSSDTVGPGNAGTVSIRAASTVVDGGSISSQVYPNRTGNGGTITITGGTVAVRNAGVIASSTYGSGNAGAVTLSGSALTVDSGGSISSLTGSSGRAGSVSLDFGSVALSGGAKISSSAEDKSAGQSGSVAIRANSLSLTTGATIETASNNVNPAGSIDITATSLTLTGADSVISTANTYPANLVPNAYAAGAVRIGTTYLTLRDGAKITSNSIVGAAGDLTITMPFKLGIILLSSAGALSTITTSSGPGTGGRIVIAEPLAIIANGSAILAKGALGGADVQITSNYFIRSVDRPNLLEVDGARQLNSNIYDVSNGTAVPTVEYLDASRVLSGQCASARERGVTSRLGARATGPYAVPLVVPAAPGGCP